MISLGLFFAFGGSSGFLGSAILKAFTPSLFLLSFVLCLSLRDGRINIPLILPFVVDIYKEGIPLLSNTLAQFTPPPIIVSLFIK